ncbi:hypothetical protein ACHAXA_007267 [Cyclostephanos tholiformis]|uniref:Lipoyl-binding domain-containing protein n=1 Tax=Cyclostephanos tholiformis TaxID=382380 RepID=A0ABD3SH14_9STRA
MLSTSSATRNTLIATARRQSAASAWSQCPPPITPSSWRFLASLVRPSSYDSDRDGMRPIVPPSPRRRLPTSRTTAGGASSPRSLRWLASAADLPYHLIVCMPALSPTMESGTISKWNVAEGDSFSAGDSLAVIETDKASMDFEAQDDGVVAKLLVVEGGGEVKCGSPIMVTVEDAADVGAFANFSPSVGVAATPAAAAPTSTTPPPATAAVVTSAVDLPYHLVVGMPALSPTMESGTISKWNVAEGDSFSAGDSLAVIETDKASMDFEAQDDGVVAKLLVVERGGEVKCGSPIMVTVEDAADVGAFANFVATVAPSSAVAAATPAAAAAAAAAPTPPPAAMVAATTAPPVPPTAAVMAVAIPTTPAATVVPPAATPPNPTSHADSLSGTEWGRLAAQKSPLAKVMAIKQREYVERYGSTGHVPVV